MDVNRRDFLKTMIAAAAAPVIMKIWVPPEKKILPAFYGEAHQEIIGFDAGTGVIIVDGSQESEPLLRRYRTIQEAALAARSGDIVFLVEPGVSSFNSTKWLKGEVYNGRK